MVKDERPIFESLSFTKTFHDDKLNTVLNNEETTVYFYV